MATMAAPPISQLGNLRLPFSPPGFKSGSSTTRPASSPPRVEFGILRVDSSSLGSPNGTALQPSAEIALIGRSLPQTKFADRSSFVSFRQNWKLLQVGVELRRPSSQGPFSERPFFQGPFLDSGRLLVSSTPSQSSSFSQPLSVSQSSSVSQETISGVHGEPATSEEQGAVEAAAMASGFKPRPLVKVCGVTTPEDAAMAAAAGADFIGMILWPHARRSVTLDLAAEISAAAREGGAQPVGVFVDEDAETIGAWCEASQVTFAQLHGDPARQAWAHLPASLPVIYVLQADKTGVIQTALPAQRPDGAIPQWVLLDGMQGGSGEKLDWAHLRVPSGVSSHGCILAGGLTPSNVAEAVGILRPAVVDVSSGVTMADKLRKDPAKVAAFIAAARGLECGAEGTAGVSL